VQGGQHPRSKTTTTVSGIGMEKAVRIFYQANASILTSSASFQGARNATAQAAQGLFGAHASAVPVLSPRRRP
jgi:bacillolysin